MTKPFRIERAGAGPSAAPPSAYRAALREEAMAEPSGGGPVAPHPEMARHAEIVDELRTIKDLVRPTAAVAMGVADAYRREIVEVMKLRGELDAIQAIIEDTKRHVASIHVGAQAGGTRAVGIERMAGELGAVAADTESATHTILEGVEAIEMLAGALQSEPTLEGARARAGEIAAGAARIYEACNFQDLTGQRITRVVDALDFIEQRVRRMVEVWGGLEAVERLVEAEAAALEEERLSEGDHALVNGPRLVGENDHVDQSAIDSLFD